MIKKRVYNSESRGTQALQTRANILKAARRLFQEHGFDRVTIAMLAEDAGVAVPTVYAVFKSKRGVLQSLIDDALPAEQFAELVDQSMTEKSPEKRLRITATLSRQIYDAEREIMDILRGASVLAPELKELERERELRRYDRQGDYVKNFIKDKALAEGLTLEKARDILWTLTGRDMYRMLVVECLWSSDEYEKWLGTLLIQSLLNERGLVKQVRS